MAHFAKINESNVVEQIIVIDNSVLNDGNGNEVEQQGVDFIVNDLGLPGTWLQTSYNHNVRGLYAEIGGTYDATHDKFVPSNGRLTSEGEYEQAV